MAGDVQKNLVPSLALFDLCRELGVTRLVFVSSGGTVYGVPQQIPTPETAPTDPITAYAISKLSVEKYLGLYRHLHGLNYRVLRVANPFGPYQTAVKSQGLVAALIARGLRNETIEIWGDGTVVRDFVFIDDVVDALVAAMSDESSERIFNIGSGQGRSVRDVIASVESVLARTVSVRWQHARPVDIPRSTLAIERAKKELGWQPKTKFEDGLAQTIQWWQRRG
jgi:UDP-glucose 4-epimerase